MWYVIVGAVLALAGIGVAVYAWRGWLGEARRSGTAATEHALALRDNDAALTAALRRADALEHQFREVIEQLVSDGAIAPVHDALTVTADNIPYSRETTPAPVSLPHVEGIAPATLRSTLELIAERAVSTDRPLARPGLVVAGGLSRNQYDALRRTLVEAGYFTPPTGKQSPTLTPRGVALMAAIREGRLVI